MIACTTNEPPLEDFASLMAETDAILNREARTRAPSYYASKNGTDLEIDVTHALNIAAQGTAFEGHIELVSGKYFPDIVANEYYGVEVKSTNKAHWQSIGSSILESTRVSSVGRIFLTFGRLAKPVEFRSRRYEECLCDISVTHYPRYVINMELKAGQTIFDKMNITYDELRAIEDPSKRVARVAQYYQSLLKPGERLWWANTDNFEEDYSPPTVRFWNTLDEDLKKEMIARGFVLCPELLGNSSSKYNRFAYLLITKEGIVFPNIRDAFTAGGQGSIGRFEHVPKVFMTILEHKEWIMNELFRIDDRLLMEYWETDHIKRDRFSQWFELIAVNASTIKGMTYDRAWKLLSFIFGV